MIRGRVWTLAHFSTSGNLVLDATQRFYDNYFAAIHSTFAVNCNLFPRLQIIKVNDRLGPFASSLLLHMVGCLKGQIHYAVDL